MCYSKNIGKGKQLYFSAFLCLKQAVRESAFRENVVVVVCSFPKDCCIFPNQFQLVHEFYGKSGLGQRKPSVWTQNSAIQDHAA
ncbi:hypothetical protein, partial [Faecalibacterium prausnitzii]|uniref:hypothetical protein n=1 Tax=Faecalibacterium prausnitzii TaxID=853 RepID=UPI003F53424F